MIDTRGFSALQRAENSSIVVTLLMTNPRRARFSALQRAENSSMRLTQATQIRMSRVSVLFSEPKIPQFLDILDDLGALRGFSALQRAENSSIVAHSRFGRVAVRFQCSSASRKFLNSISSTITRSYGACFSALQRAENSSIVRQIRQHQRSGAFQCSSASRKFLNVRSIRC